MASSVESDSVVELSHDQLSPSGTDDNENTKELAKEDSTVDKTDTSSLGGEKDGKSEEKIIPPQDKPPKPPKGFPPIDFKELNNVLRHPNMPSKKILHEVADKVLSSNDQNNSDGSGGITGMKGLFDCILEVSLKHTESDNSDEEEEDEQSFDFKFPCVYCHKVFLSSMEMKTHILVLHSKEDPSVLNLKQLIVGDSQKVSPGHRRSRESSKADRDTKEQRAGVKQGDENGRVNPPQSSSPRLQRKLSRSGSESGASLQGNESKAENVPTEAISSEPDIHSEKESVTSSKLVVDPTTSGNQSPKNSYQLPASSQQLSDGEAKNKPMESVIDTPSVQDRSTSLSSSTLEESIAGSSMESESPKLKTTKKRGKKEDEEEGATTPSAAKKGKRTRTRQAEEGKSQGQDNKPSLRRSSRRH